MVLIIAFWYQKTDTRVEIRIKVSLSSYLDKVSKTTEYSDFFIFWLKLILYITFIIRIPKTHHLLFISIISHIDCFFICWQQFCQFFFFCWSKSVLEMFPFIFQLYKMVVYPLEIFKRINFWVKKPRIVRVLFSFSFVSK